MTDIRIREVDALWRTLDFEKDGSFTTAAGDELVYYATPHGIWFYELGKFGDDTLARYEVNLTRVS